MVADAFQWIIASKGVQFILHYVDDTIVLGRTKDECEDAMNKVDEESLAGKLQQAGMSGGAAWEVFSGLRHRLEEG